MILKDEEYTFKIRELVPRLRDAYLKDKRLVYELIKMEIREHTTSFVKKKQELFPIVKKRYLRDWKI